jgi:cytoskeletal protein RodZ
MRAGKKMLVHVAWSSLLISVVSGTALPVAAQQAAVPNSGPHNISSNAPSQREHSVPGSPLKQQNGDQSSSQAKSTDFPDSPGAIALASGQAALQPNSNEPRWELASTAPQTEQSQPQSQSQSSTSAPQSAPQRPVGTAAAEAPNATGIAASQPAGVAIAPAKQRRVRTIVLRMGAIVGAGVAVGSVVALTAATPSKPPGAH